MPDTRTEPDHTSWLVPVMVFGVIMALGVGSGAAAMLWATSDDDEPVNTTAANTTQAAETSQPTQPNDEPVVAGAGAPDTAVACRETLAAADAVLGAAREGLSHWGAHVQAEVDYRALRITRDEQKKIFSETGALGPQDIKVFKERDDAYKARGAACGQLDPATVPSADNCVDRNNAVADAVAVGRKAMSDWETHLANMGKFRQGELDPSHAQHLWELAAQQASANIDAFWTADHALQNAPSCNV